MAEDLAARISDGVVAVTELVPGERRFGELSQYVLRGGASRFAAVVRDDEPVRYVLPAGIPGAKLHFGVLLIQRTRCALVWRSGEAGRNKAQLMTLDAQTQVSQSPATIRGEVWGRFDLHHPSAPDMTFLVPPVVSPALPRALHRVLVEEPGSRPEPFSGRPLAAAVTEAGLVEPDAPDADAGPEGTAPAQADAAASDDLGATQPLAAVDAPAPRWTPRVTQPAPAMDVPLYRDEAVYREASRSAPLPLPPAVDGALRVSRSSALAEVPPAPQSVAVERRAHAGMPATLRGFVTGLAITLVIGGLFAAAKYLGLLG